MSYVMQKFAFIFLVILLVFLISKNKNVLCETNSCNARTWNLLQKHVMRIHAMRGLVVQGLPVPISELQRKKFYLSKKCPLNYTLQQNMTLYCKHKLKMKKMG